MCLFTFQIKFRFLKRLSTAQIFMLTYIMSNVCVINNTLPIRTNVSACVISVHENCSSRLINK